MGKKNQTIVLFDVMDTLVYNPFHREVPDFFGLSSAELIERQDLTAWVQFELGQIDEAEYFRRYFHDGSAFDHSAFRQMMHDAYRWIEGAQEILDKLSRAGFPIHALSNYPIWYRTIESKLYLSRYLKWTYVSCLTGVRKPAAEAFQGPARGMGHPVDMFLLIDDSAENCDAARSAGLSAIQFVDAKKLLSKLAVRGLIHG